PQRPQPPSRAPRLPYTPLFRSLALLVRRRDDAHMTHAVAGIVSERVREPVQEGKRDDHQGAANHHREKRQRRAPLLAQGTAGGEDRKSTRLNSSHVKSS